MVLPLETLTSTVEIQTVLHFVQDYKSWRTQGITIIIIISLTPAAMRWVNTHKHGVHIVLQALRGTQHRRSGLTVKRGRIRESTHAHCNAGLLARIQVQEECVFVS